MTGIPHSTRTSVDKEPQGRGAARQAVVGARVVDANAVDEKGDGRVGPYDIVAMRTLQTA